MPLHQRVVITGMGLISPLGLTLDSFWKSLSEGKSGVSACAHEDGLPIPYAAFASEFDGEISGFGEIDPQLKKTIRKGLKLMSREIQMCVAATQRALLDADIAPGQLAPERVGTSIGSDYILTTSDELLDAVKACCDENGAFDFGVWGDRGLAKMNPLWQLKYLPNMPSSHVAICNDFRGVCNSVTLREASIGASIGEAVQIIASGKTDVMVVGATGSRLHPVKMIHALQTEQVARKTVAPEEICRPFDRNRCGMVLGEGAGTLVLESEEHALGRGARIYAEIPCGTYVIHFGRDRVPHRRAALKHAMTELFYRTGTTAGQIGHVNAHGLSTETSDKAEARAIHEMFEGRHVPVTAAKSYFGNLGAGSGAVELIAGVLALQHQQLFPILNNMTGDPDCPMTPVREFGAPAGDSFVKLAVSPQAQATAILVRKYCP